MDTDTVELQETLWPNLLRLIYRAMARGYTRASVLIRKNVHKATLSAVEFEQQQKIQPEGRP